jgi:hypothetical protein
VNHGGPGDPIERVRNSFDRGCLLAERDGGASAGFNLPGTEFHFGTGDVGDSGNPYGGIDRNAKHLRWPEAKVRAAVNYAEVFPEEIEEATSENDAADFKTLKRMLPQATEFVATKPTRS